MNRLKERELQILGIFKDAAGWEDRYRQIISKGQKLQGLKEELKTDDLLVKGCQSRVWIHAHMQDGMIIFQGESEALITRGLLALLLEYYSGLTPKEVLGQPPTFIEKLDLIKHLTPSRGNGLISLLKQIQSYAQAFSLLNKQNT